MTRMRKPYVQPERKRPQELHADQREHGGQPEADAPRAPGNDTGEGGRHCRPGRGENRLLHPERGAAASPPGQLRCRRERQAVPPHRERAVAATTSATTSNAVGASISTATRASVAQLASPRRSGRCASRSRPTSGRRRSATPPRTPGSPRAPAASPRESPVRRRETAPRTHDRDLRDQIETASAAQQPEAAVAQRRPELARLEHVLGRLRLVDDERAERATGDAQHGSRSNPTPARDAAARPPRSDRRADRGLPHAQRETALRGRKPVHDCAPARGVDARAAPPARKRRANSETNSVAYAAPTSAAAQRPSPSASTTRCRADRPRGPTEAA